MIRLRSVASLAAVLVFFACATDTGLNPGPISDGGGGDAGTGTEGGSGGSGADSGFDAGGGGDADLDAGCALAVERATTEFLPVDIIWVVDNSISMQPVIDELTQGLNDFAALIAKNQKQLDYRVIMLSLRSETNPVQTTWGQRYGVCIPEPLAGDANCGNGPRFFQSSIDIHSTQPLEQFLGTLGDTAGYQHGDEHGPEPGEPLWKDHLRPLASKTIVVVSDDNARMVVKSGSSFNPGANGGRDGDPSATADFFEHFAGGKNPFNSRTLPAGILEPEYGGLFDGYVFSGLYGWGSESNPSVACTYSNPNECTGTQCPNAESSGPTYTELVNRTGGVRAQICDGASAWAPFFDGVATAIDSGAKLSCQLDIPEPSQGTIDPDKVNVFVQDGAGTNTQLFKVGSAADCDQEGGWYYDDDQNPSQVILCPASCNFAQGQVQATQEAGIAVQFGCQTVVR